MTQIERADNFMRDLGVEAYRVGGSVRDEILGRPTKDADYMVRGESLVDLGRILLKAGAKPSALKLRDGRQAGWRANVKGMGLVEIVLPRTERPRNPKPGENTHRAFDIVVDPYLSIEEDAIRRDFTFNALYRAVTDDAIIDPLGGVEDLRRRLVQVTHADSFRDDPLRTLRALRFVSVLGYELAPETRASMMLHSAHVTGLSANGYASGTVYEELCKILMGDNVQEALRLARDTGVLGTLLPELAAMLGFDQDSKYHDMTTDEHTFSALHTAAAVAAPLRVRLALLFHDSGKPATAWVGEDGRKHYYARKDHPGDMDHERYGELIWRAVADRLSIPRRMREDVAIMVRDHMVPVQVKTPMTRVNRWRVKYGDQMLQDLLLHRMCDLSGKQNKVSQDHMNNVAKLELLRRQAAEAKVPAATKELLITGKDAMAQGIEGQDIGRALNTILDEVVCQPDELTMSREWQLKRLEALA
jgi:tRNA nucleotidyltransferase (CCA-adding enzyme)